MLNCSSVVIWSSGKYKSKPIDCSSKDPVNDVKVDANRVTEGFIVTHIRTLRILLQTFKPTWKWALSHETMSFLTDSLTHRLHRSLNSFCFIYAFNAFSHLFFLSVSSSLSLWLIFLFITSFCKWCVFTFGCLATHTLRCLALWLRVRFTRMFQWRTGCCDLLSAVCVCTVCVCARWWMLDNESVIM